MNKFQNKYRIPSARLKGYDYGQNGAYFITICTHERIHYFGEIVNDEMQLNELGQLAEKYWLEIPVQFPFIELGEFIVMPNHMHGILIIDKMENIVETRLPVEPPLCRDAINRVSTKRRWHHRTLQPHVLRKHFANCKMVQRTMFL